MKTLEDYIAFDLEFNQYEGAIRSSRYLPYVLRTVKKSITTTPTFTPISP